MEKHTVIWIGVMFALIASFAGGYVIRDSQGDTRAPQSEHTTHMDMGDTMSGMVSDLTGKTGEEFDRAFLAEMIVHHEGAVTMAQQALQSASHAELKQMAQDIITAQNKEIAQMKAWLKEWAKN